MSAPKFEVVRPLPRVVAPSAAPAAPPAPPPPLAAHTSWLDEDVKARAGGILEVHEHGPKEQVICSTGLESLDRLIGGWMRGQTYIVAGKTGGGKTSFATHSTIMLGLTAERFQRAPALYFSLEMTPADMADRTIAWVTGIPQDVVQMANYERRLTDAQAQAVSLAHQFATKRIRLVSTTDASVTAIRAAARHAAATHGVSAIVVDYIGLIEAEPGASRGTREREVAFASRGLRAMAMELNVPVIVLCQLGRRADKEPEPHLSMLRESGSIENDASGAVLFLWPKADAPGCVRIVVAKRRFGRPWVETTVGFDGATGRFEDLEHDEASPPDARWSEE